MFRRSASLHRITRYFFSLLWAALILIAALPSICTAKNIFDDDWTPPAPRKSVALPLRPPATAPTAPASSETPPPVPLTPSSQNPTAPAVTNPVLVPPAAATIIARRPVPGTADQAKSRKLFKEVFAAELADRSPAGRRALAAKLLGEAVKVADVSADQFVLLAGATEAASDAGDLPTCVKAADALGTTYDVDALRIKSDLALKMPLRAGTPATNQENCRAGLMLVEELVRADDYATAARLLSVLRSAAATDPPLALLVQNRSKEVDVLRLAAERIATPLEKLRLTPTDLAANLAVGQYYCFTKDDWTQGLPLLAKSAPGPLKAAATLDLANPTTPDQQIEAGHAWWAIADREAGLNQTNVRERAVKWYRAALKSGAVSGLNRALLEKRLAALPAKIDLTAPLARSTPVRNLLLFGTPGKEYTIFKNAGGGKFEVISKKDTPAAIKQANTFANVNIVVIERNRLREMDADDVTPASLKNLQRFVEDGGDLVIFEQYGTDHMGGIDTIFGIKTSGGDTGAQITYDDLKPKIAAAGYTEDTLKNVHFYNSYSKLPKDSVVLVQDGHNHNTAVVAPFGRGRLILIGTNLDSEDLKLDETIIEMIYPTKP